MRSALDRHEPQERGDADEQRDPEAPPHPEHVVGVIDPQRFLEQSEARVAGDVQREHAGCPDSAPAHEPRKPSRQEQIPDDLVEEGGLKGGVAQVPRGAVREVDPQRPGQRARPAEQLLIEIVAQPADRPCAPAAPGRRSPSAAASRPCSVPAVAARTRADSRSASTPPQIPRPPFQTANGPHQCGGIWLGVVIRK